MTSTFQFIETKEYHKFVEFCDSCAKYKYIGVCHGLPGVGKTVAAKNYSKWETISPTVTKVRSLNQRKNDKIPIEIAQATTIFTTAPPVKSANLYNELRNLAINLRYSKKSLAIQENKISEEEAQEMSKHLIYAEDNEPYKSVELVIIDEVDRLKLQTLEILRDIYDQNNIGMVLIGMNGLEKKLSRYPQLYSRIGFSHEFKKIAKTELQHILEYKWQEVGLTISYEDFEDYEAINSILKLSNGNLRLLQRLFTQIDRVMEINNLQKITTEVIEVARKLLIIGTV
ncbi:hypothetical protein UAY_02297 [Enterococcus moraviensis ATCC BAA-383]|uniref:ORC1/DEAH AAA+ ATPase domain-containing protein n=1 Tax=Enterococcus moraviensis ATCC BAA-383 TaxID=1158609 RepID=R2QUN6_9ENTE|nr:AAA family ATPase [Enterococcus moraviensis]EOH99028.1 hypothetical protein UAY_02297 [Enterococcus moraviensis ATCC BAA-383]EOT71797.1 hypothetical protein I586_01604 [Enterococcus moraviensis ATCC BAA-383]